MNINYSFSRLLTRIMMISLLTGLWVFMSTSVSADTLSCTQQVLVLDQSDTENNEANTQNTDEDEEEDEEPECD